MPRHRAAREQFGREERLTDQRQDEGVRERPAANSPSASPRPSPSVVVLGGGLSGVAAASPLAAPGSGRHAGRARRDARRAGRQFRARRAFLPARLPSHPAPRPHAALLPRSHRRAAGGALAPDPDALPARRPESTISGTPARLPPLPDAPARQGPLRAADADGLRPERLVGLAGPQRGRAGGRLRGARRAARRSSSGSPGSSSSSPASEVSGAWLGARLHYREGSAPLGYIPGANWTKVLCDG